MCNIIKSFCFNIGLIFSNLHFHIHQVILELNQLCADAFKDKYIVPKDQLTMPLLSTDLDKISTDLCNQNRTFLVDDWLSKCCELLVKYADAWRPLVPTTAVDPSFHQVKFYYCILIFHEYISLKTAVSYRHAEKRKKKLNM